MNDDKAVYVINMYNFYCVIIFGILYVLCA